MGGFTTDAGIDQLGVRLKYFQLLVK